MTLIIMLMFDIIIIFCGMTLIIMLMFDISVWALFCLHFFYFIIYEVTGKREFQLVPTIFQHKYIIYDLRK